MDRKTALAQVIGLWREHSGRTLNYLADKTDLNYGTIRNVAEGKAECNGETALRILLYIYKDSIPKLHGFVVEYYPELSGYTQTLAVMNPIGADIPSLTPSSCRAMIEVCCSPDGCSEEKATQLIGANGTKTIEGFIDRGVFRRENGRLLSSSNVVYLLPESAQKTLGGFVVDSVDKTIPGNLLHVIAEGLNQEGSKEFYGAFEDLRDRLMKIMNDPTKRGDIKVVAALGMTIV